MKLSGSTYIEVILMVALTMMIGIMAAPFYGNFFFGQESDIATEELHDSLNKARFFSMVGKGNDQWGVTVAGGQIVLFKGSSYDNRDIASDETYTLHALVTISGMGEVVFERRTGIPSTEPTITISLSGTVDATPTNIHTLTVNHAGVVNETLQ
ncbi:MAG: hypothetical protein WA082_03795 [Candidatus Moraniibacteriota bacterium]